MTYALLIAAAGAIIVSLSPRRPTSRLGLLAELGAYGDDFFSDDD